MAMYTVHFRDGSVDVMEAKTAAAAREKAEDQYGEVKRVVIQPEDVEDPDAEEVEEEDEDDE